MSLTKVIYKFKCKICNSIVRSESKTPHCRLCSSPLDIWAEQTKIIYKNKIEFWAANARPDDLNHLYQGHSLGLDKFREMERLVGRIIGIIQGEVIETTRCSAFDCYGWAEYPNGSLVDFEMFCEFHKEKAILR